MAAGALAAVNPTYIPGLTAGLTLAAHQYKCVKWASTAKAVILVAATTDVCCGVVQNDPAAGEAALVQSHGIAICWAGTSTLTAGQNVGYDTTGRVINHTTETRQSIGRANDPSTAVGDYVRIALYGGGSYDGVGA